MKFIPTLVCMIYSSVVQSFIFLLHDARVLCDFVNFQQNYACFKEISLVLPGRVLLSGGGCEHTIGGMCEPNERCEYTHSTAADMCVWVARRSNLICPHTRVCFVRCRCERCTHPARKHMRNENWQHVSTDLCSTHLTHSELIKKSCQFSFRKSGHYFCPWLYLAWTINNSFAQSSK